MNDFLLQPRTVLVAFGSKRGGTAGIAALVAEALREPGLHVDVQPAGAVHDIRGYDAVIVGGALYAGRWHRDARRFVQRLASDLRARPVWFFSSGPLGDSARGPEPKPTASVARLMSVAGARGHVTFGGCLQRDADGFLARAMAAKVAGDWRDPQVIRTWASGVAVEIAAAARSATEAATNTGSSRRPGRSVLAALCLFSGITAICGGIALAAWPDGSHVRAPLSLLRYSPFPDFSIPGLLLFGVVGLTNLAAGILAVRRSESTGIAGFLAGGAMTIWIVMEMLLLRSLHGLQLLYLGVGLATLLASLPHVRRQRHAWRPAH